MTQQDALTIVAPVKKARRQAVVSVLDEMKLDPGRNSVLPFGALPSCHFGRVVLLPEGMGPDGTTQPDALLLISDCDGSADDHLEAMVETAGDGLDRLFGGCDGYPSGPIGPSERLSFLKQRRLELSARYVHQQGRTVDQVQREAALRKRLQLFVASHAFLNGSSVHAREEIRAFVAGEPELAWALVPADPLDRTLRERLHHVAVPLGLVALGPAVLSVATLWLLIIRLLEARDHSPHIRPTDERMRVLNEYEDWFASSGYTSSAFLKPGRIRETTVTALLALIGWGARYLFTRSSLAGVRTIHFAQWIPIGGGRFMFCSNYDGSIESYNNDFIDLVGAGLNLIFSNVHGYPRTTWLIRGGSMYEQEFKDFLRRMQLPTTVWHAAYPNLTVANIDQNSQLRAGLSGSMNEKEARQWLRLI